MVRRIGQVWPENKRPHRSSKISSRKARPERLVGTGRDNSIRVGERPAPPGTHPIGPTIPPRDNSPFGPHFLLPIEGLLHSLRLPIERLQGRRRQPGYPRRSGQESNL